MRNLEFIQVVMLFNQQILGNEKIQSIVWYTAGQYDVLTYSGASYRVDISWNTISQL